MLQVDAGVFLHTRWLRPCIGSALRGEFNTPVVHDQIAGTLVAVLGASGDVDILTGDGALTLEDGRRLTGVEDLRIAAGTATIQSERADLLLRGRVLEIVLHR